MRCRRPDRLAVKGGSQAVLMMTPRSPVGSGVLVLMAAAARRVMLKVPTRLTIITFWNMSGVRAVTPTVRAAGQCRRN